MGAWRTCSALPAARSRSCPPPRLAWPRSPPASTGRSATSIVTTELDFPTLLYQWKVRPEAEMVVLESSDGVHIDPQQFADAVDDRTLAIATSHVFFTDRRDPGPGSDRRHRAAGGRVQPDRRLSGSRAGPGRPSRVRRRLLHGGPSKVAMRRPGPRVPLRPRRADHRPASPGSPAGSRPRISSSSTPATFAIMATPGASSWAPRRSPWFTPRSAARRSWTRSGWRRSGPRTSCLPSGW